MENPGFDASVTTPIDSIRPFVHTDAEAVAGLFQTVMAASDAPPPPGLADYFRSHFLDGPFADPEIPSLVCTSSDGGIDGFIGVAVQKFRFENNELRAAILGTLMARDHASSPMTGARLLKKAFAGAQDVTLSETAGDASLAMWKQLGGSVLDRHSLTFVRVLRPARFALDTLAQRIGAARLFVPLAGVLDRRAGRKPGPLRWTGLPADFRVGVEAKPIDSNAFFALAADLLSRDAVVPIWPEDTLNRVITEAMDKPPFGQPHLCAVVTRTGKAIGGFLFHFAGEGPARMVDILHAPGQAGPVLDALFAHANALGAASVQGRTTPALFDALLSRRTLFFHDSASVIDTGNPELLTAFQEGRAPFNGLVGERWTRMIGGSFS